MLNPGGILTKLEYDSLGLLSLISHLPPHLGACHPYSANRIPDFYVSESGGAASKSQVQALNKGRKHAFNDKELRL